MVESEVSDPPADGSSIRIELIEILSSETDALGTLYGYSNVEFEYTGGETPITLVGWN